MEGSFSISWQSYQNNICNGFSNLQQRGELVDMTLAADGHHVQVHKAVMSLVSPYIKDLITTTQCAHPVIFLNNVSHETLKSILEYVYTGESLVPHHRFQEFMQACRSLNINGLDNVPSSQHPKETRTNTFEVPSSQYPKKTKTNTFEIETIQDSTEEFDDTCDYAIESSPTESDSIIIFQNDNCSVEDISTSFNDEPIFEATDKKKHKTCPQYTVSNQGNLQIILNRYMYFYRYQRKTDDVVWRCIDYYSNTKCSAMLITKDGKVIKRVRPHNHSFHDKRILKCSKNKKVYSMLSEAQYKADILKKDK